MGSPTTILKPGGSLARDEAHLALFETIAELATARHRLVIVPGGGVFADAVRRECSVSAISSTAAHWMAVLAMDQMAYLFAGQTRSRCGGSKRSDAMREARFQVARSAAGIARALERNDVPILAPFSWLHAADPLPHSWDVTSDSIAAWVAAQLGAQRLVLLKSVDGICDDSDTLRPAIRRTAIEGVAESGNGIVDGYLVHALAATTECWVINGRRPERLRALVEYGATTGTVLC